MVDIPDNPENPDNSFDRYLDLPPENRMHIVDSMRPGDRIRFTRCSRMSRTEAMSSQYYMYGLEFNGVDDNTLQIHVYFADNDKEDDEEETRDVYGYGFILEYKLEFDRKCIVYSDLGWNELWRHNLPSSADLIHLAAEQFKKLLTRWQNKIKKLIIHHWPFFGDHLQDYDFEVERLTRLEILEIKFNSNILQFITRLRHPLKRLLVYDEWNNEALLDYEWSSVQQHIYAPFIAMNYEQFLELKASRVTIHMGEMTEKDIYNYIKLWQADETGKAIECYIWGLEGADFDVHNLFRLLGLSKPETEESVKLFLKHNFDEEKVAVLHCENNRLTFDTDPTSIWSDQETDYESEEDMEDEEE